MTYHYRGREGWDPAAAVAPREGERRGDDLAAGRLALQEAARRRAREFARRRDAGMGILAAGAAVGVSRKTASRYEEQRLASAREAGS